MGWGGLSPKETCLSLLEAARNAERTTFCPEQDKTNSNLKHDVDILKN